MSTKIGYRVIFASSNETGHDAQELELRNSIDRDSTTQKNGKTKGKGWQSARFCEYPQDLVIALDSPTQISQIQLLSHQSKIASKVEIWVGLDPRRLQDASSYKSMDWKRLGYLSLDKNERSNWKARELKSVYIHTTANYMKLSLHESHINSINLFNQIGIVALTVLGKATMNELQPTEAPITDNQSPLSLKMNDENTQYNDNNRMHNNNQSNPIEPAMDAVTSNKIRELMILKKQAVETEDYDEAKRCKLAIEHLQSSAKQLSKLEKEKKIAVEKEDYDTAKALKLQIERLRVMSLNPEQTQINPMRHNVMPMRPPSQQPSFGAYNQPPPNVYNQPSIGNVDSPNSVHFAAPPQRQASMDHHHVMSHSHSQSMSPHHPQYPMRSVSVHPDDRQIRPMKKPNYNAVDASASNPFGDDSVIIPKEESVPIVAERAPNNSNGSGPAPLKASVKKGSEKSIEMFGEYTIRLVNSTNWNHRDEGLKEIASFVAKKEHPDGKQVFKLSAKWIYAALQDRVAGVILSGIDSLNALISAYDKTGEVEDHDMCKSLHSIVITLVNILGHSNNRLIDGSGSILIRLCHHNEALCRQIYNILIKKMKKLLPKHLKGRGLILLQLLPQFNVPKGVDLNALMDHLIQPQLRDKNGDVRDLGIQLTGLLYGISAIRNRVVHYLENAQLNDFIKDSLNHHFEEMCGTPNVLEREPKSIKEKSRPSKAMNRTSNQQRQNTQQKRRRRGGGRNKQRANGRNKQQQMNSNNKKPKQEEVHAAAPPPFEAAAHEEDEEAEDMCNFCGLRDASFMENEENLDLHYWQSCPMLTSCKLCEQVIEIATLHEHILTECESGIKHELCAQCNIPYVGSEREQHQCVDKTPNGNGVCPLCLKHIPSGSEPWKQHLLKYPGCKANPRPLLQ
eukprot:529814_1